MGLIYGRVIDANNGNGIAYAGIRDNYGLVASCDVYGQFYSTVAAPSGYYLTGTAYGYNPTTHQVTPAEYSAQWTVIRLSPAPPVTKPDCCFSAETPVRMAGSRIKAIGAIAIGDIVEGANGYNRVLGIERPMAGGRPLWGINGGVGFATAEHPFMTMDGWKSVDPMATALEGTGLLVAALAIGDSLVAYSSHSVRPGTGALAIAADPEPALVHLRSLEKHTVDPETPVYNLLLDGDHTYFAADLLVHNKW